MNEATTNNTTNNDKVTILDPLDQLNEIKKNTVSKEEYERILNERNAYFKAYANGDSPDESTTPKKIDVDQLRKDLFVQPDQLSNLDYAKKSLELRQAILDETGKDIFVGSTDRLVPDQYDYDQAQRSAELLQYCIEQSNNDVTIFNAQLNSHLQDIPIPKRKGK